MFSTRITLNDNLHSVAWAYLFLFFKKFLKRKNTLAFHKTKQHILQMLLIHFIIQLCIHMRNKKVLILNATRYFYDGILSGNIHWFKDIWLYRITETQIHILKYSSTFKNEWIKRLIWLTRFEPLQICNEKYFFLQEIYYCSVLSFTNL